MDSRIESNLSMLDSIFCIVLTICKEGVNMSNITDYSFLFQSISRMPKINKNRNGTFKLSQLDSSSVQAQLKAARHRHK